MRSFILKTLFYIIPFLISFLAFSYFGSNSKGELIREGALFDFTDNYREQFSDAFNQSICYTDFSKLQENRTFDILTIGDSFSQQGEYGYQNYLCSDFNLDILHYDKSTNGIQISHELLNGDFFDSITVRFVLLQSVERYFTKRLERINKTKKNTFTKHKEEFVPTIKPKFKKLFFSPNTIKFPILNLLRLIDDNALISKVFSAQLKKQSFTTGDNQLLFLAEDLKYAKYNNEESKVNSLVEELNSLSNKFNEKGIKLIVLPSPDKYGVYHDNILNKENYIYPHFFYHYNKSDKSFLNINSDQIIKELCKEFKDVYFYDDSHWSPICSKELAKHIFRIL